LFENLAKQSAWQVVDDYLIATDEQWQRAIETYGKEVPYFRSHPLEYRTDLNEIFDGTAATGEYARGVADDRDDADEEKDSLIDEIQRPQFDLDLSTENSQRASTVSSTPGNTSLSNSMKRRLQTSSSISSNKRLRTGEDEITMLARVIAEKDYNIPGGGAKEKAIEVLQESYKDLSNGEFMSIMDCFNNPQNVLSFNYLRGERRDAWVRHIIDTTLPFV
jgi:hypothetical protein